MIEADKRKAIFLLHEEGMPLRQIARRLHVSRNTVAVVIAQGGQLPKLVRAPKQKIDVQLLERLYEQSGGWIQRMHEKLAEEQGIEVKYSTLTRILRQLGMPTPPYQPKNRRYPSAEEEKRLRALDPEVSRYLDFALQSKVSGTSS